MTRYALLIIARVTLLVGYFPIYCYLIVKFYGKYSVYTIKYWSRSSHFCYVIKSNDKYLFLKVRNSVSSLYNSCVGHPQPHFNDQMAMIMALPKNAQTELFPAIYNIDGMVALDFLLGYFALDKIIVLEENRTQLFAGILKKTENLHSLGYVHGDIKLKNIMYNPKNQDIKFVDLDYFDKINAFSIENEERQIKNLASILLLSTDKK